MRHRICKESIVIPAEELRRSLSTAESLESQSHWFLAGERYLDVARLVLTDEHTQPQAARAFARAATCFELAGQNRDAARAYFEAASILHNKRMDPQAAGELFNRAAFSFTRIGEFFNAGDSYRRAAAAFADSTNPTVHTEDNIPPVPSAAGKYTVAADCLLAAAEAFEEGTELAWARATYWDAGKMNMRDPRGGGTPAYDAYRKALVACIRFDQTHDREQLRKALPMSNEERDRKVDPIEVLEKAARDGKKAHQQINVHILDDAWVAQRTDEMMISAFHEFYLEFLKVGNVKEAQGYYVREKIRQKALYKKQNRVLPFVGFWVWGILSDYGEGFARWLSICVGMLLLFAALYGTFDLIEPTDSWIDYPYFSVITFTTLGYGDIHPQGAVGKVVASLEAILGLLMVGMLLTIVSRRVFR